MLTGQIKSGQKIKSGQAVSLEAAGFAGFSAHIFEKPIIIKKNGKINKYVNYSKK